MFHPEDRFRGTENCFYQKSEKSRFSNVPLSHDNIYENTHILRCLVVYFCCANIYRYHPVKAHLDVYSISLYTLFIDPLINRIKVCMHDHLLNRSALRAVSCYIDGALQKIRYCKAWLYIFCNENERSRLKTFPNITYPSGNWCNKIMLLGRIN